LYLHLSCEEIKFVATSFLYIIVIAKRSTRHGLSTRFPRVLPDVAGINCTINHIYGLIEFIEKVKKVGTILKLDINQSSWM